MKAVGRTAAWVAAYITALLAGTAQFPGALAGKSEDECIIVTSYAQVCVVHIGTS